VPMPWTTGANLGFTRSRSKPWLPIPKEWAALSVASQRASGDSMLSLYRSALALRRTSPALGRGELRWVSPAADAADLISFDMVGDGATVRVLLNLSGAAIELPEGELLLASEPIVAGQLPAISAAWVARPASEGITARLGALVQLVADVIDPRR
jgi:alpha-glucosidase